MFGRNQMQRISPTKDAKCSTILSTIIYIIRHCQNNAKRMSKFCVTAKNGKLQKCNFFQPSPPFSCQVSVKVNLTCFLIFFALLAY